MQQTSDNSAPLQAAQKEAAQDRQLSEILQIRRDKLAQLQA